LTGHSVIIPAYNAVRYVVGAIESALQQLGPDDEVIVVDNGSSDGTLDLLEQLAAEGSIRLFHETTRGPAAARNRGMREARGRYISFLDADDLWPAGRHEGMMRALDAMPAANAVYGRMSVLFDEETLDGRLAQEHEIYETLEGSHVPLIGLWSYIFRRDLLERGGEQNEAMMMGEDVDYILRLRDAGMNSAIYDGLAIIYRRHGTNLTRDPKSIAHANMSLIARHIRRKRGQT
jgi:glycosyltransferase involved in cell wall biosynthesis